MSSPTPQPTETALDAIEQYWRSPTGGVHEAAVALAQGHIAALVSALRAERTENERLRDAAKLQAGVIEEFKLVRDHLIEVVRVEAATSQQLRAALRDVLRDAGAFSSRYAATDSIERALNLLAAESPQAKDTRNEL